MRISRHLPLLKICLCVLLTACAPAIKKHDYSDMYALPNAGSAGQPIAVDNDSYYRQPATYKGCTQINDAPSCGGG